MAASYNDMFLLSGDATFQGRVGSALWQTCVNISNEAWSSVHQQRKNYVAQVLNNPVIYKPFFVNAASVDATVIADATQAGTVVITSGNVAAQGALVTDVHLANAIAAAFNAFVSSI
jgi:hypothetical protein